MAKKEKAKDLLIPLRLLSVEDLARYSYNFDFTYENVFTCRTRKERILYAFGERIGDGTVVYFTEMKQPARSLLYKPPENGEQELAQLLPGTGASENGITSVLEMPLPGLELPKPPKPPKPKTMMLGSIADLIKLAIKGAGKEDGLMHLCCFEEHGKTVLYGTDLVPQLHDDISIVYYATAPTASRKGFAMYDYKTGAAELTGSVGEHSYMYLKIVNLAERPPFFTAKL